MTGYLLVIVIIYKFIVTEEVLCCLNCIPYLAFHIHFAFSDILAVPSCQELLDINSLGDVSHN